MRLRMSLAVITMVKDEASRYLPSALAAWKEFADEIIALDDHSSDGTREMLEAAGATVHENPLRTAWGAEAGPRSCLFDRALESGCEWLLWLDADMVPARDPRTLFQPSADGVAFPLFDLWGASVYRSDAMWSAHKSARVWAVRNPGPGKYVWLERGLHCGHLPLNLELNHVVCAPMSFSLLHYGYVDPQDRVEKCEQYLNEKGKLNVREILHAQSIIDDAPRVQPLKIEVSWPLQKGAAQSAGSEPTT